MSPKLVNFKSFDRRHLQVEKLIAIVALINLLLVFFDVTYLFARPFYFRVVPALVQVYDPLKGILPHPETADYLNRVTALEQQVIRSGLPSAEVEQSLAALRTLSDKLIADNPFAGANQSDSLESIKQALRSQTGQVFVRDAFDRFWSQAYLSQAGWQSAIAFWRAQIQPLMAMNYYRSVNRFGYPVDYFWLLDLPFVMVFAIDLVIRLRALGRRHPELTWLERALRRWYDWFLLLPFARWLRVLPVTVRLYQVDLLNLEPVRAEAQRDFVISFAAELTEMVGIQVIEQLKASVHNGEIFRWIFHPESRQPYIQVNATDEVMAIATQLVNISLDDVLPQIQPDIEELIHHSVKMTLTQLPAYQQWMWLPGLQQLPTQIAEAIAKPLLQMTYHNLASTMRDPVAAEITGRLSRNFRDVFEAEFRKRHNFQQIQSLLLDLLEEIKLNYVRGIAEIGIDQMVDEVERLHRQIRTSQ